MDHDDDLDDKVQDLVQQLQDNNNSLKKVQKTDDFELNKDELEQFLLNKAGKLINDSLSMVDIVKQYVESAPNSEDVGSLADLLKATTSSIDTLSKILVQNKRSETMRNIPEVEHLKSETILNLAKAREAGTKSAISTIQ